MHKYMATSTESSHFIQSLFFVPCLLKRLFMYGAGNEMMSCERSQRSQLFGALTSFMYLEMMGVKKELTSSLWQIIE